MALLDHFRPPLSAARHWESFHSAWAGSIADALNRDLLPQGYFAEEHVHVGSRVEIDVAAFHGDDPSDETALRGLGPAAAGGASVTAAAAAPARAAARSYAPPVPTAAWPAVFPDSLEVLIYSGETGPTLVAAVELVSPANKDRIDHRRAFAAKCAAYLQQGVGLVVIDIVTTRIADLHHALADLLETPAVDLPTPLSATAYRPLRLDDVDRIDLWRHPLSLGQPLPFLPLALDKGQTVPLDLEATYAAARARRRIGGSP